MSIEKLKKIASRLMTSSLPKLHMEIDGKQLRMDGAQSRAFGCGVDVALKTLADEIDNKDHHITELEQRLAAAEFRNVELSTGLRWACDVYMIPDELSGDDRESRLHRSIAYAINHGAKYWNSKAPMVCDKKANAPGGGR